MQRRHEETFWDRLKKTLKEAKKPASQTDVAEFLGIKQPSVSEWSKPGGYPTVHNAVRLAEHAGVCVEWLFTGRGPVRPMPIDPVAQRLWDIWPKLDDMTKGELIGRAAEAVKTDASKSGRRSAS